MGKGGNGARRAVRERCVLQALLLLIAILIGSLGNVPRARADVQLVDGASDPAPIRGEKVSPAAATSITSAPAKVAPDTIQQVVDTRQRTTELDKQRVEAMQGVQEALASGTPEQLEQAKKKLAEVNQQLEASHAQVNTALDDHELATQAVVESEKKRVYGPDGPTLLDKTKSALATAGGLVAGAVEGTVKGVGDMVKGVGNAIVDPVGAATNFYSALTRPAPTAEQLAATDKAALEKERTERIAQVSDPFQTAREGGEILGRYGLAPILGGEALGAAAREGSALARGGAAAGEAERPVAVMAPPYLRKDFDPLVFNTAYIPAESSGFYNVVIHGSPESFWVKHNDEWLPVSHRTLAQYIERAPGYHGQPVRLLSCRAGACDRGVAQNLSNKLGVPVEAATDVVSVYSNGVYTTDGSWWIFTPRGPGPRALSF